MRLWSLHPSLLDAKGLVACWRETLLAQQVLEGKSSGYTAHPQLVRFRADADPLGTLGGYLGGLWEEATARGYRFDRSKIHVEPQTPRRLQVSTGQLEFEAAHLLRKLQVRDPQRAAHLAALTSFPLHPIFDEVTGPVADWERDPAARN